MNMFNDYEDIIGKPKTTHLKNTMHDFFGLCGSIRNQLGKQGYLIDKYVYDLLNSISAVLAFDSEVISNYSGGSLQQIILNILECKDDYKKHPIYEKAREYIDEHPLPYQEQNTKIEIYYIALIDDFLEHTTKEFFDDRKDVIRSSMDMVESRGLCRKISTLIGGEEAVTISVADSGCGIDDSTMHRIFDKFYQGDTSHSQEGNGLGLALVLRVVELSGGQISAKSIPGEGSTFTVTLKTKI